MNENLRVLIKIKLKHQKSHIMEDKKEVERELTEAQIKRRKARDRKRKIGELIRISNHANKLTSFFLM